MRRTDVSSGSIRASIGLINVVGLAACVVMVLTGSLPLVAALLFAATLWAALRHWPPAADGGWATLQATLTVALLAGAAVAAALAKGFVIGGLLIAAALAAPTQWIRGFSRGAVRQ